MILVAYTLLDCILAPEIRLGISTPNEDPSGDYAQEIFRQTEQVRLGTFNQLNPKTCAWLVGVTLLLFPIKKNKLTRKVRS